MFVSQTRIRSHLQNTGAAPEHLLCIKAPRLTLLMPFIHNDNATQPSRGGQQSVSPAAALLPVLFGTVLASACLLRLYRAEVRCEKKKFFVVAPLSCASAWCRRHVRSTATRLSLPVTTTS